MPFLRLEQVRLEGYGLQPQWAALLHEGMGMGAGPGPAPFVGPRWAPPNMGLRGFPKLTSPCGPWLMA